MLLWWWICKYLHHDHYDLHILSRCVTHRHPEICSQAKALVPSHLDTQFQRRRKTLLWSSRRVQHQGSVGVPAWVLLKHVETCWNILVRTTFLSGKVVPLRMPGNTDNSPTSPLALKWRVGRTTEVMWDVDIVWYRDRYVTDMLNLNISEWILGDENETRSMEMNQVLSLQQSALKHAWHEIQTYNESILKNMTATY